MKPGKPEKYPRIAEQIRAYLKQNRVPEGARLPSEREFAALFSCTHVTVRKAFALLERTRRIYRIAGRGRYAGPPPLSSGPGIVGFLVPDDDVYYFRMFSVLEREIAALNLYPLMCIGFYSAERESSFLRYLEAIRAAAVIAVPSEACAAYYRALSIPTLFFDNGLADPIRSCVRNDDASGACSAVDYLYERGCRSIAHLGGTPGIAFDQRYAGYLAALQKHGLRSRPGLVLRAGPTRESGYYGCRKLLALPRPPDGIFCGNDTIAGGAMAYLLENRLDIPLVGFGNTQIASDLRFPSVSQHEEKLTLTLVRNLKMALAGEDPPSETIYPAGLRLPGV